MEEKTQPNNKKSRRWISTILRALLVLILLLLLAAFALQIPAVQKWGVDRLTNIMSERMETEVKIESFNLNIFRHLEIGEIFIAHPERSNDTLLYSQRMDVRFKNLLSIFNNKLVVDDVSLNDGLLRFERTPDKGVSTITYLLDKLSTKVSTDYGPQSDTILGPEKKKPKRQFQLSLKQIDLRNMRVSYADGIKSANQYFQLEKASIDLKQIDLANKVLHASGLNIFNSQIKMTKYPPKNEPLSGEEIEILVTDDLKQISDRLIPIDTIMWQLIIDDIDLENVAFEFDDYTKSAVSPWSDDLVDLHHLRVKDVDITMNNFRAQNNVFDAEIENIQIALTNGFTIEKIAAYKAHLDSKKLVLENWVLQTPNTYLRDQITLHTEDYHAYETFEDAVRIEMNTPGSRIAIRDFVRLVPNLSTSAFFQKNIDKSALLTGKVDGTINDLAIRNMNLKLGGVQLLGDFKSENLALGEGEHIHLDLDSSHFRLDELEGVIPDLTVPQNFKNLGLITFLGEFDGSFEDFTASGDFQTDLGKAQANIQMNVINGKELATYNGALSLFDFDLGKFMGDDNFGTISLNTRIKNGIGLTEETATADLDGVIEYIDYNGYAYEDIQLTGSLNQKLFDGSFSIESDDINLSFQGLLDRRDSIPNYNFKAAAQNLDLFALNLSNQPLIVSGDFDVNMRALDLDKLYGNAAGRNVRVIDSSGFEYALDSIIIESSYDDIDLRSLNVQSDIISGNMVGAYKIREVIPLFKQHLINQYPRFFGKLSLPDSIQNFADQRIIFRMQLDDSKNWFDMMGVADLEVEGLKLEGAIDSRRDQYQLDGFMKALHYKNLNIYNTELTGTDDVGLVNNHIVIQAGDFNEQFVFEDIDLENVISNDSLSLRIQSEDIFPAWQTFDVNAVVLPDDDHFVVRLSSFDMEVFDQQWSVDSTNEATIWADKLGIANMSFSNGAQGLKLTNLGDKGIELKGTGFETDYINEVWDYEQLNLTGNYAINAQVDDVFELKGYSFNLFSNELLINESNYGVMDIMATMDQLGDPTQLDISIVESEERHIKGSGYLILPLKEIPKEQHNDWLLNVDVDRLPMTFWEYIIGENISETKGYINADLVFDNKIIKSNMRGEGRVYEGSTKVNYLGTTYSFHDQPITVTPELIDMTGAVLTDAAGNRASVTGGITHQYIKDLGLDAVISSPKFIGLQTTPEDNSTYYGYAVGRMYVTFKGRMDRPSIDVNAETGEGTYLAFPIDYGSTTADNDFVTFTTLTRDSIRPIVQDEVLIEGVNFSMNVTMNEGATVEMIFNEDSGEILRGTGNGDIQFSLNRNGVMNMTGVYEIASGNYLFTNFFIRKPFVIQDGGTIRWDGDPFDADINIEAEYERLRASTALFIQEYLINASPTARNDASARTEIDLTLILSGILSEPDIDFRIGFPNLTGEVRGYVDSKMRILQSDPNAMLEQVMGLLLTRSFIPTNTIVSSAGQVATSSLNNTLSELISAQLSQYLSGIFESVVENVSFLDNLEFDADIAVNPFGNSLPTSTNGNILAESGNEVGGRFIGSLFDDRLNVEVGGNFTTDSPLIASGQYFAGDYLLEYDITDDRRLKIKAYHRNTLTIEGRRNKFGLGLTYRIEFDNFADLFSASNKNKAALGPKELN